MPSERRLVLPTNWDPELLPRLAPLRPAYLYGSLPAERTLRTSVQLPQVGEREVEDGVAAAAAEGIGFLYVMNATCAGNSELSEEGRWKILQRCQWLCELGASGVTLANPYVVELVRRSFPELEVHVSVLAGVDSPRKASFYRDLGVTGIYLAPEVNRDFRRLRSIRRAVDCRLSVLVNEGCLLQCPLTQYHANVISHSGESIAGRYHVDYCYFKCSQLKAAAPAEYLQMPWIRPEDLGRYEELGIDYAKLAGREKMGEGPASHSDWIVRAAEAYHGRRCDDVAELLVGVEAVAPLREGAGEAVRVRIDSRALDGFLRFFERDSCDMGCGECRYCDRWAERAVTLEGDRGRYEAQLERDLERVRLGSYWTGEPGGPR